MKTNRSGLLMAVIIAMIASSSCSVEYRARHPRPPRHKRVIVVGKADANEKINSKQEERKADKTDIAVY